MCIIRNWLNWLWRLRSHLICSWEAPIWVQRPENQENWWCKLQFEGRRLILLLKQSEREWILPSSIFLFYSSSQGIELWDPHWGRQFLSLTLPIQMLISSRNIFTDNTGIIFHQILWHPIFQSSRHIKDNYHIYRQEKLDWNLFHMVVKGVLSEQCICLVLPWRYFNYLGFCQILVNKNIYYLNTPQNITVFLRNHSTYYTW